MYLWPPSLKPPESSQGSATFDPLPTSLCFQDGQWSITARKGRTGNSVSTSGHKVLSCPSRSYCKPFHLHLDKSFPWKSRTSQTWFAGWQDSRLALVDRRAFHGLSFSCVSTCQKLTFIPSFGWHELDNRDEWDLRMIFRFAIFLLIMGRKNQQVSLSGNLYLMKLEKLYLWNCWVLMAGSSNNSHWDETKAATSYPRGASL